MIDTQFLRPAVRNRIVNGSEWEEVFEGRSLYQRKGTSATYATRPRASIIAVRAVDALGEGAVPLSVLDPEEINRCGTKGEHALLAFAGTDRVILWAINLGRSTLRNRLDSVRALLNTGRFNYHFQQLHDRGEEIYYKVLDTTILPDSWKSGEKSQWKRKWNQYFLSQDVKVEGMPPTKASGREKRWKIAK
jgi:hypothetical protein